MFTSLDNFDIYKTKLDLPENIISNIYKIKQLDPGTPKTNKGGWHSKTFTPYKDYYNGIFKWTQPLIEQILDIVRSKWPSSEFNRAWFNLSYEGGTNRWHNHGAHPIVGVLYIQIPEGSSSIEFEQNQNFFQYMPSVGDLLIFPGKLQHRVLAHNSMIDRISMAINFD
jgi:hypothetical protein